MKLGRLHHEGGGRETLNCPIPTIPSPPFNRHAILFVSSLHHAQGPRYPHDVHAFPSAALLKRKGVRAGYKVGFSHLDPSPALSPPLFPLLSTCALT